jgi:hypothetical protein
VQSIILAKVDKPRPDLKIMAASHSPKWKPGIWIPPANDTLAKFFWHLKYCQANAVR